MLFPSRFFSVCYRGFHHRWQERQKIHQIIQIAFCGWAEFVVFALPLSCFLLAHRCSTAKWFGIQRRGRKSGLHKKTSALHEITFFCNPLILIQFVRTLLRFHFTFEEKTLIQNKSFHIVPATERTTVVNRYSAEKNGQDKPHTVWEKLFPLNFM